MLETVSEERETQSSIDPSMHTQQINLDIDTGFKYGPLS